MARRGPWDARPIARGRSLQEAPERRDTHAAWQQVRSRLRAELGDAAFTSWLAPLVLIDIDDGEVKLGAPTKFLRDWVASRYAHRIAVLWALERNGIRSAHIAVAAAPPPPAERDTMGERPARRALGAAAARLSNEDLAELGSPLNGRFTFREFVVGKPNEFAHAAARRVAEANRLPFNPLYLYGGVGLGKTHLMHAIAWCIREQDPTRRVLYLSAEKFMYHFVRAVRYKDTMAFKEQFRSVDVLMIDDVQFICGKDSTQEEFFHTLNALVDHDRQVVISGDRSPSDLNEMEERLRSRLGWGLVADIHATTYELRLGILQAKSETMGLPDVPREVLEFLAHRITSNVRELEMALNRVAAHAMLIGDAITLELTRTVLRDVLRANDQRITIEEIQRRVAEHYNIRLSEMSSHRRSRAVAQPRQVAMFLAKQLTTRSLPEIGRKFGGRDHTTVMHAVRRVEERRQQDTAVAEDVELLLRSLEGTGRRGRARDPA